jgi:hypothetical protein
MSERFHHKDIRAKAATRGIKIVRIGRHGGGGTWVRGVVMQYRFDALVFRDHAISPSYEIGMSRISKLLLRRRLDDTVAFAWDRGLDQPTADFDSSVALLILCDALADIVHGPPLM